jgi:hypothetical protein
VSCHHPDFGFAEPDQFLPVSEGVITGRFATRNSPSAAHAMFFPELTLKGGIQGGQCGTEDVILQKEEQSCSKKPYFSSPRCH